MIQKKIRYQKNGDSCYLTKLTLIPETFGLRAKRQKVGEENTFTCGDVRT